MTSVQSALALRAAVVRFFCERTRSGIGGLTNFGRDALFDIPGAMENTVRNKIGPWSLEKLHLSGYR